MCEPGTPSVVRRIPTVKRLVSDGRKPVLYQPLCGPGAGAARAGRRPWTGIRDAAAGPAGVRARPGVCSRYMWPCARPCALCRPGPRRLHGGRGSARNPARRLGGVGRARGSAVTIPAGGGPAREDGTCLPGRQRAVCGGVARHGCGMGGTGAGTPLRGRRRSTPSGSPLASPAPRRHFTGISTEACAADFGVNQTFRLAGVFRLHPRAVPGADLCCAGGPTRRVAPLRATPGPLGAPMRLLARFHVAAWSSGHQTW
jgi:hypothetical protein